MYIVSTERNYRLSLPVKAAINQIALDNSSGAAEILRRAGAVFSLLTAQHQEQTAGVDPHRTVIETCVALVRAQPDMSPILRLASAAASGALAATDAEHALNAAEDAATRFVENSAFKARAAALHASNLVCGGASVLTHSRSSTVLAAFKEAHRAGGNFSVIATESRPLFEGRALAEALVAEGIPVTLIADGAASLMMDQVDFVFLGADKVTPQNVVNKIGTRMIVLAAQERSLPVYALCDTSKFIQVDYLIGPAQDARGANEMWPNAPRGVVLVNRYFEQTPLPYFTAIITEDGALASREAARRADEAMIDRVLEDALGRS